MEEELSKKETINLDQTYQTVMPIHKNILHN